MYRINYGNGTVSDAFTSKKQALAEFAQVRVELYGSNAFIQFYEDGDWFQLPGKKAIQ